MIKLTYFDFNFWRIDILRLSLSFAKIPYEYEVVVRKEWPKKKKNFPFGQLPIMTLDGNQFSHTHTLAKFCATKSSLYDNDNLKILVIDQVIDWANEITNLIAPSIRAALREKNFKKSKKLREEFIQKEFLIWFSYLERLFINSSKEGRFFTDKFSIADITAWRIIYWFRSGILEKIDITFLKQFPNLEMFYDKMCKFKDFTKLKEYKIITSN